MKELTNINPEKTLVKLHNTITASRYEYSAVMLDILFMTLALIDEKNPSHREVVIYANDIKTITGKSYNKKQLREATAEMGSRVFEVEDKNRLRQIWLFSAVEYHWGTGSFSIHLNEHGMPYLFDLKREFTSINLKAVLSCSSKYAKRLYAIACQWRKVGFKSFTIEELKLSLGLKDPKTGEEQFERVSDFKKFVLDIAIKQINEFTDVKVSYRLIKRGRSFQKVDLYIDRKEAKQLELFVDYSKTIEENKIIAMRTQFLGLITSCGVTESSAEIIMQHSTINEFENIKADALDKLQKGLLLSKNVASYIVGVYQKKGILPKKGEKARTSADGALVAQIAETIAKGKTKK